MVVYCGIAPLLHKLSRIFLIRHCTLYTAFLSQVLTSTKLGGSKITTDHLKVRTFFNISFKSFYSIFHDDVVVACRLQCKELFLLPVGLPNIISMIMHLEHPTTSLTNAEVIQKKTVTHAKKLIMGVRGGQYVKGMSE